jgi:hypothetical protein
MKIYLSIISQIGVFVVALGIANAKIPEARSSIGGYYFKGNFKNDNTGYRNIGMSSGGISGRYNHYYGSNVFYGEANWGYFFPGDYYGEAVQASLNFGYGVHFLRYIEIFIGPGIGGMEMAPKVGYSDSLDFYNPLFVEIQTGVSIYNINSDKNMVTPIFSHSRRFGVRYSDYSTGLKILIGFAM